MAAKKPEFKHRHKQIPFRFDEETVSALDQLKEELTRKTGIIATRTDTVRKLILDAAKKLSGKS